VREIKNGSKKKVSDRKKTRGEEGPELDFRQLSPTKRQDESGVNNLLSARRKGGERNGVRQNLEEKTG